MTEAEKSRACRWQATDLGERVVQCQGFLPEVPSEARRRPMWQLKDSQVEGRLFSFSLLFYSGVRCTE